MDKREIRFAGLDKTGKDSRFLEIEYDQSKNKYHFAIRSSIGKLLGSIQLPRNLILEPIKFLHGPKNDFLNR